MSIISGQTALASDFIASSAGVGDAGKGVKLGSDGKIDSSMAKQSIQLTPDEDITVSGNPVPIVTGLTGVLARINILATGDTGDNLIGRFASSTKVAQKIVPSAAMTVVSLGLNLKKSSTPTDNFKISIQTDNAGVPSGTELGSATLAGASIATSYTNYTLSVSASLSAGVTYWVVYERSGGLDSSKWFETTNGSNSGGAYYASGNAWVYNGSSWSEISGPKANYLIVNVNPTAGRFVQGFANNSDRLKFLGFIKASAVAGVAQEVFIGFILAGFTSLTAGSTYFLQNDGSIGTSAGSNSVKVGRALSSTTLLIISLA